MIEILKIKQFSPLEAVKLLKIHDEVIVIRYSVSETYFFLYFIDINFPGKFGSLNFNGRNVIIHGKIQREK